MKEIPLTKGLVALVDDEDFEFLNQWRWYANKSGSGKTHYARRAIKAVNGKFKAIFMHKVLLAACGQSYGDHKDGNGLNNQKSNLRPSTPSQNGGNTPMKKNNTSGFKGVFWDKRSRRWYSRITKDRKNLHLGMFPDRLRAAVAYDKAATELFGQFAKTNQSMGLL